MNNMEEIQNILLEMRSKINNIEKILQDNFEVDEWGLETEYDKNPLIGSRRQVYDGIAERTKNGLKKFDLIRNDKGRIITKKNNTLKRNTLNRLGYSVNKGKFGMTRKGGKTKKNVKI